MFQNREPTILRRFKLPCLSKKLLVLLQILSLTNHSSLKDCISNVGNKSEVFLTIKNVVNILIDNIPTVPFGSVEQAKIKKSMNSDEIVNFNESEFMT